MSTGALPLSEGGVGESVSDLQTRLAAAGLTPITDPVGTFGPSTRAAVEAFQRQRGLRIDGIVGTSTWTTLVEAGLRLGDRLLYRAHPMLRGDDVAELQSRLCSLGFDTGRVDGIFGDLTSSALAEFQRNVQLPADATAGLATVSELVRVSSRHQTLELVSMVRERELLRSTPPTLSGRHVGIGEIGGLGSIAASVSRRLAGAGARVTLLHHPEESGQAHEANVGAVDTYIGLRLRPDDVGWAVSYYSGYSYESTSGRELATRIVEAVPQRFPGGATASGMSVPVLRETRMPAVVVEIGPLDVVVERATEIGEALASAIIRWAETREDSSPRPDRFQAS